jgi:hypothetical protein
MREKQALCLRDLALNVVMTKGAPIETRDGLHLMVYADDRIRIAYRPKAAGSALPNGIDVWRYWTLVPLTGGSVPKVTKVLNVQWDDHDAVVVGYKGGSWETTLRRLEVPGSNVVPLVPKTDGEPVKDAEPLETIEGDDPDNVDITDATFGAHAIYTALSTVDLANTTPEIFWSIFGTSHLRPGTVEWLDGAIKKLTEIAEGMPQ